MVRLEITFDEGTIRYILLFRNKVFYFTKLDTKGTSRKMEGEHLWSQMRRIYPNDVHLDLIEDACYDIIFGSEEEIESALELLKIYER